MNFSQRLCCFMDARKISAYKMGKDTGISDRLIGYWRKGEKLPNAENLIIIATYFSTSIDYLLTGKELEMKTNAIEIPKLDENQKELLNLMSKMNSNEKELILEKARTIIELKSIYEENIAKEDVS